MAKNSDEYIIALSEAGVDMTNANTISTDVELDSFTTKTVPVDGGSTSSSSTALVAGIAGGSFAFSLFLFFFFCRKRKKEKAATFALSESDATTTKKRTFGSFEKKNSGGDIVAVTPFAQYTKNRAQRDICFKGSKSTSSSSSSSGFVDGKKNKKRLAFRGSTTLTGGVLYALPEEIRFSIQDFSMVELSSLTGVTTEDTTDTTEEVDV